jgi:hypothetical protein
MTPTDPMLVVVLLVIGLAFLGLAGLLEWWAMRNPAVGDRIERIVERILGWV